MGYRRYSSYRRKRSYSRSYGSRFSSTPLETIRSRAKSESYRFVRERFFAFPSVTFEAFLGFYTSKYGSSAASYLRKTYPNWKCGITSMSGKTGTRILNCVPRFLSREDQISLLKFYLPWIHTLREANLSTAATTVDTIVQSYEEAARHVRERDFKLDWFINEVFSAEEVKEFLLAFKFMLLKRLELSYQCVCRDLERLNELVQKIDFPVSVNYHISYLDRPLRLTSSVAPSSGAFRITQPVPQIFQTTDQHLLKVLSDDAVQMRKEQEDATVKAFVSANDVQMALSQIHTGSGQEIDSTVEANGEGGRITLHFVRRDEQRMRYEVSKNGWMFAGACALLTGIYFHGFNNGYIGFLLFPGGFITIGILSALWGSFQESKKELENYERNKAARFAEG
jgi:hypothetical protein